MKTAGWLTILLLIVFRSPQIACNAQDNSRCGHSTVEEAWGQEYASRAKLFLAEVQRAVESNDKKQFALLVQYPVRVLEGTHSTDISNATELTRRYPMIMTSGVRRAILAQSPSCLFANGQGVMIGRGQIWFQQQSDGAMRIVTINLSAPDGSS